ncbi:MAG TPA: cellulose binding domain-containing protein, partial [Polyangiales bacterium]
GGPGDAGVPNAPSSAGSAADGGAGRSAKDPDAADGGGAVNAADGGGALIDHGVTAQYYAGSDKQSDDVIYPILQISNVSVAAGVPLYELEIRYYFHNEHEDRCPVNCQVDSFWAGEHPSGKSLTAVRRWVSGSDGADYLSVTFPATLEVLARGAAVEMQQQLHTAPFSQFDQSDDYSFDATKHALTDWPKVTVYRAGSLVWGTPP